MKARMALVCMLMLVSLSFLSTACDKTDECCFANQMINPWEDNVAGSDSVTTPSVQGVQDANVEPTYRTARFSATTFDPPSGAVAHWPLWWENPFVEKGDGDSAFAMTWADYVAAPYGLGRFILNTMGWPVSATVQPVWTVMESDGVISKQALGYDHDATKKDCSARPDLSMEASASSDEVSDAS